MITPLAIAAAHVVVGTAVILGMSRLLKFNCGFGDALLTAVAGAVASLVPSVGGTLSFVAMLGVLYWRSGGGYVDVAIAVGLTRLVMVAALYPFSF